MKNFNILKLYHSIKSIFKQDSNYHIYSLIWGIPKEYGGMTAAVLYRCFLFSNYSIGSSLTILTMELDPDVEWLKKHICSSV